MFKGIVRGPKRRHSPWPANRRCYIGDRKCGALRIPREDWGTLGKIGGITIPTLRILLLCSRNEGMIGNDVAVLHCFGLLWWMFLKPSGLMGLAFFFFSVQPSHKIDWDSMRQKSLFLSKPWQKCFVKILGLWQKCLGESIFIHIFFRAIGRAHEKNKDWEWPWPNKYLKDSQKNSASIFVVQQVLSKPLYRATDNSVISGGCGWWRGQWYHFP